ncbi:c-type cytochrome biogenesis protein CcmI [Asaia bogorensis]|uniref:c-type cytochrome biogenesis protein CcmI n=1 Tax=Asaia bogorensis TaxID=91915 RepID=UPI000EFD6596|nr:c-type cytochrome biogenesis protein CcmI [Asaia bogorensis]
MSWTGFLLVTLLALSPLLWLIFLQSKRQIPPVGPRLSALSLYRKQLSELDRDIASGLIDPAEAGKARLEIQRRILAADALPDDGLTARALPAGRVDPDNREGHRAQVSQGMRRGKSVLWLPVLPIAGLALYLVNGHPSLPPQPHQNRARSVSPELQALFGKLARQVATLSPQDPDFIRSALLLGQVDEAINRPGEAIGLYRRVLAVRFIPDLAVQVAELQTRRDGHISPDSLALYRRAVDEAPADAPWRLAVEARIATGEHENTP